MKGRLGYVLKSVGAFKWRFSFILLFVALGVGLLYLTTALSNALTFASVERSDSRLFVLNGLSSQLPLPRFYEDQIAAMNGVERMARVVWVGAYFQQPDWQVSAMAVDPSTFFTINTSLKVDSGVLARWKDRRNGVLIDERLSAAYRLSPGDRLPLQSSIWQLGRGILDLEVIGTVEEAQADNPPGVYLHYDFLEANRTNGRELVSYFLVSPKAGTDPLVLAQQVDDLFAAQAFQGTTETAPIHVHMLLFASKMFDFGSAILWLNAGICALMALLLVSNLYVLLQRSVTDYMVFGYLGFSRRWMIGTAFLQLAVYVLLGGALGLALGAAATTLLPELMSWGLPRLTLLPGDYLRGLLVFIGLVLVTALPAMLQVAFLRISL